MTECNCEMCNDTGWMCCFIRSGEWKCAGPAPDDARGCYDVTCECEEGDARRYEFRQWRIQRAKERKQNDTNGKV